MKNNIKDLEKLIERTPNTKYTLTSVKTMCPALIFAASRKESVIGRTNVLTVSIRIRKGFSHEGAPPGRREARVVEVLNLILEIIKLSHKGRPKASVKNKWEEELNT